MAAARLFSRSTPREVKLIKINYILKMSEAINSIWSQVETLIAGQVSPDTMERWFSNVSINALDEVNIVLKVPNQIYQFWIETNYLAILTGALESVIGGKRRLAFQFGEADPLGETNGASLPRPPSPAKKQASARKPKASERAAQTSGLNHRYRFDTFVVGSNNEFAHAACTAAAQKPGRTYNPLFIYGGAGLGKTHLMHGIGHAILQARPKAKLVYITSECFTNEFIEAIGDASLVKFRQRYRDADVLLIDDIHFFAGKERSQEEFFHTFNTLCDSNGKQVVMSSDLPASKIKNLEKRLVSRFEWGLTAELGAPDMETRLAILRNKAKEWQVNLDAGILEYVAQRVRNNVRRLEGALVRLASFISMNEGVLDLKRVEKLLADFLHDEGSKEVSMQDIQKRTAEFHDVRLSDLLGRKRTAQIAHARQVAMYLCREFIGATYQEIGDAFGGRDHGTVMHACRSIKAKCQKQEKVRHQLDRLHGDLTEPPER